MNLNESNGKTYLIPIDPVAKGRPRLGRNGHTFTPKKTKDAEKTIQFYLKLNKCVKLEGALAVRIIFRIPKPKSVKREFPTTRPDLDNYAKLVLDAANGYLYEDDSQVVKLLLIKEYALKDPHILITICPFLDNY